MLITNSRAYTSKTLPFLQEKLEGKKLTWQINQETSSGILFHAKDNIASPGAFYLQCTEIGPQKETEMWAFSRGILIAPEIVEVFLRKAVVGNRK